MWRSGIWTGLAIAFFGLLWLHKESADESVSATTIRLPEEHLDTTQDTTHAILNQIEATAPWILKVSEKSSTKS